MSETEALEPGLTKADKRVLKAIPSETPDFAGPTVTIWQLGEALDTIDLRELMLTLNGLRHLGYIYDISMLPRRHYRRTRKGDEAIA